jgi:beta-glucanase (GH16 family)
MAPFDLDVVLVGGRGFPAGSVATVSATAGSLGGEGTVKVAADGRLLIGFRVPDDYSGPVAVTVTSGAATASASMEFTASAPSTPVAPASGSATPVPTAASTPASTAPAQPDGPPPGASGWWKLVFDDEFSGSTLDRTKWQLCNPSFRAYCLPWNNELEVFNTAATDNANVRVADGQLQLVATKDANGQIHSGMVSTGPWPSSFGPRPAGYQGFTYTYGYYEGRVRIPRGNGYWPSMWELPANTDGRGAWPDTGEFDVFEIPGNNPTEYHFTAHWGGGGGDCGHPCSPQQATISDAAATWHTYGLDWEPNGLTWYVDGKKMGDTITNPAAIKNTPFFLIANLSVGGSWGPLKGGPDASTPFPGSMDIDWVRVYQHG